MLKKLTNKETKKMKREFRERRAWIDCNHDCWVLCGSSSNDLFFRVQVELDR